MNFIDRDKLTADLAVSRHLLNYAATERGHRSMLSQFQFCLHMPHVEKAFQKPNTHAVKIIALKSKSNSRKSVGLFNTMNSHD